MSSALLTNPDQSATIASRLQRALNAAQIGTWQFDPLRHVFLWDGRCKELFGITDNETTLEEFLTWVHPDDVERVLGKGRAALHPAEPKRSTSEYRVRRRDGEVRWVETFGQAHFEDYGHQGWAVHVVGTIADITERKEREERERLLMREVSHRAKNMLSVVHAIAQQTATKNPEDFLERFSERIQALSASQDLLIRNDWRGVDVQDLVYAQLAPFADLIGSRIAVKGPKLCLQPASAQAIGLALHELATNSSKFGSLSTETGRLHIGWSATNDNFTMGWAEREGPPVSTPQQRGFGTTVLGAMMERSVDGQVNIDYSSSGLTWRLTCPVAKALSGSGS